MQILQHVHLLDHADLVVDDGRDVRVEDLLLLVGDLDEPLVGLLDLVLAELVAELLAAVGEAVPARVPAEHHPRADQADRLRRHDLVRRALLEHAVHVDARLVGEGVGADDRLVRLHHEAGQLRRPAGSSGRFPSC